MITNTTHSEGVEKQGGFRKKVKKLLKIKKKTTAFKNPPDESNK